MHLQVPVDAEIAIDLKLFALKGSHHSQFPISFDFIPIDPGQQGQFHLHRGQHHTHFAWRQPLRSMLPYAFILPLAYC